MTLTSLAYNALTAIHHAVNQRQLPTLINNAKYLLSISSPIVGEDDYTYLLEKLKKAEKVLTEWKTYDCGDSEITTYEEKNAALEKKLRENEQYIIEITMEVVKEVVSKLYGKVFWE